MVLFFQGWGCNACIPQGVGTTRSNCILPFSRCLERTFTQQNGRKSTPSSTFRLKPKSLFIRKLLLALAVFIVLILIEVEGLMQLCFPSLTSMNCSWAQTRNRAGALLYVFFFFLPHFKDLQVQSWMFAQGFVQGTWQDWCWWSRRMDHGRITTFLCWPYCKEKSFFFCQRVP